VRRISIDHVNLLVQSADSVGQFAIGPEIYTIEAAFYSDRDDVEIVIEAGVRR
jgi:hypothetical protein